MLRLIPKSSFSWRFTAFDESVEVADLDTSTWREKATLTIQGVKYSVYREGLMSGDFILESAEAELARAEKPSVFRRCFVINHAGRLYTLRATSSFTRRLVFLDDSREVGSIASEGFFTRRAIVDLPDEIPLPVKIFIAWLAVILWKRESHSG
jgi:hypothetical protein